MVGVAVSIYVLIIQVTDFDLWQNSIELAWTMIDFTLSKLIPNLNSKILCYWSALMNFQVEKDSGIIAQILAQQEIKTLTDTLHELSNQ